MPGVDTLSGQRAPSGGAPEKGMEDTSSPRSEGSSVTDTVGGGCPLTGSWGWRQERLRQNWLLTAMGMQDSRNKGQVAALTLQEGVVAGQAGGPPQKPGPQRAMTRGPNGTDKGFP